MLVSRNDTIGSRTRVKRAKNLEIEEIGRLTTLATACGKDLRTSDHELAQQFIPEASVKTSDH